MDSPTLSEECYPYTPPPSLWMLVEKYVPVHELGVIKEMLGESIVEQSLELHEEVSTLLAILQEYKDETEQLLTKHRLPEPPAVRELLKEEIKFFVASIKDKAKETGRDDVEVLSRHKSEVIDYALNSARAPSSGYESRPSTAQSSHEGRETPMINRPSTARSELSTVTDEVQAVRDKLTYLQFDQVVQHLRETLEEEVTTLSNDIEFLQNCLDDEADFRTTGGTSREPTLTDLKEERKALESDLLTLTPGPQAVIFQPMNQSPNASRPNSSTSQSSTVPPFRKPPLLPKAGLTPASNADPKLHPVPPVAPIDHKRPGPFKASHRIRITNIEHDIKTKLPDSIDDKATSVQPSKPSVSQATVTTGVTSAKTLPVRTPGALKDIKQPLKPINTKASPAAQRFRRMVQENR